MEIWQVETAKYATHATVTIRKPGAREPVYQASRDTPERALLACLNGAYLNWAPGAPFAFLARPGRKVERVRLEFPKFN